MQHFLSFLCIFLCLFILFPAGNATSRFNYGRIKRNNYGRIKRNNYGRIKLSCRTISVDQSGRGNFTRIQDAIDAVPQSNSQWVCIRVAAGLYKEQVIIPVNKPFIYLTGAGKKKTSIVSDVNDSITSATFNSQADNIIVKSLTIINSYNYPIGRSGHDMKPAVAALIQGDKSAFYRVGFIGVQDTLWDVQGRHYFEQCTIQGAVDFIFGSGQSFYERCTIAVVGDALGVGIGYITAQGRSSSMESNGFVFKDCTITGMGKAYLGRPWRPYARVLFYNTLMPNIVVPQGWDSWYSAGREDKVTFDELNCRGPGSDKTRRVDWSNRQSVPQLQQLTSLSYIDASSWLIST